MRTIKIRAASENRKLHDVIAELLRWGLAREREPATPLRRVQLPLIHCAREAPQLTAERVAEILLEQEAIDSLR